jgi:hypothetical protein
MVTVIREFLQDDGIVVIDAVSSAILRDDLARELPALGCADVRVMTLRRLPGALAVGYAEGADLVTRVYGKLVGEFFEALVRVVVGAEVFVKERFKKPKGLVGLYFTVAVDGAEFPAEALSFDEDLRAVDLSAAGIRKLSRGCLPEAASLRRSPSHRNWRASALTVSPTATHCTWSISRQRV